MFVNLIQIMLVAGMVYPVYAMWNNDQLSKLCVEIKPNMTKQHFLDMVDNRSIKINLDNIDELKWQAKISVPASLSDYSCQVRGVGERVASATMAAK